MDYKSYIVSKLNVEGIDAAELISFIEIPPNKEMGDYALPCFKLAKLSAFPFGATIE